MTVMNESKRDSYSLTGLDEESVAKIVFLRLDPILKFLLKSVSIYHGFVTNKEDDKKATIDTKIIILRKIAEILSTLKAAIQDKTYNYRGYILAEHQIARSLLLIFDYVSLPLLALLRMPTINLNGSLTSKETILQSATWKCVQLSAEILQVCIERIYGLSKQKCSKSQVGSESENCSLPHQMIIKCLTACGSALPTGEEITETRNRKVISLDSYGYHVNSIFQTIFCIVTNCFKTSLIINESALENVLDGAFLARTLDSAIAFLEPPSIATELNGKEDFSKGLQMTSLSTIIALIQAPFNATDNRKGIWSKVFPGVFAGLYRRALHSIRLSTTKGSDTVVLSMTALCSLLQLCLATAGPPRNSFTIKSSMQMIKNLSLKDKQEKMKTPFEDADKFTQNTLSRVPATLIILINISTAAKSDAIRLQAVDLNATVLLKTRQYWTSGYLTYGNDASLRDLTTTSIESCMILSNDESANVSLRARQIVQEYYSKSISDFDVGYSLVPRLMSLMESLPLLAQSKKENQIVSTLKLAEGYLSMKILDTNSTKALQASLMMEDSSRTIRKALTVLLDIDFGFLDTEQDALIVTLSEVGRTSQSSADTKWKILSKKSFTYVIHLIHSLGRVLGPQHTSSLCDDCVADMFESLIARLKGADESSRQNFIGQRQTKWLHEWIGTIVVVQELLIGAYSIPSKTENELRQPTATLEALAKSVLPILTHPLLWEFPLVLDYTISRDTEQNTMTAEHTDQFIPNGSRASIEGNTRFTILLLGLVQTIIQLLERDNKLVMFPNIIVCIIEKTSSGNPMIVRQKSLSVLNELVAISRFSSMSELLATNVTNFTGSMIAKLRLPGGRTLSVQDAVTRNVLSTLNTGTSFIILLCGQDMNEANKHSLLLPLLGFVEDLANQYLTRFDFASSQMKNIPNDIPIRFLDFFNAVVQILLISYNVDDKSMQRTTSGESQPWFELLDEFSSEQSKETAEEGFARFHYEQQESTKAQREKPHVPISNSISRDTDFVAKIASRCCYMLSHETLRIQILSCEVLSKCFIFLGWVAINERDNDEEANGPKTAILRLIHGAWPAIIARLKATTTAQVNTFSAHNFTRNSSISCFVKYDDVAEQRIYLSKIYSLLAVMTECADDFMASRFRQVVWPCIGQIMQNYVRRLAETNNSVGASNSFSHSEKILLGAILECISRLYRHRPAGEAMAGLIPSIGTLVYPILESKDVDLQTACKDAIKKMLLIDCDSLYGLILKTSGTTLPTCPFKKSTQYQIGAETDTIHSQQLTDISKELLTFIESLPEQPLL